MTDVQQDPKVPPGAKLHVTDPFWLAHLEQESGISRDVIARAALFTCSDGKAFAKMKIGTAALWQVQHMPALVIPYRDLTKREAVLYAAKPRTPIHLKDGKPAKYMRTKGALYCYLPPDILERPELLDDRNVPLLITEGEKKTLAACTHGFPCIGIAGVHTWGRAKPKRPPPRMHGWGQKDHNGVKRLFEPMERAAKAGKDIFIVFDSDAAENLLTVRPAETDLALVLTKAGATVYVVRLPPGPEGAKAGLDDYLIAHGANAFRRLLHEARERGPECTPEEAARHRKPELILSTNHKETTDKALEILSGHDGIYQRGGNLVRMTRELGAPRQRLVASSGAPRVTLLPRSILGEEVSDRANIRKVNSEGGLEPAHPSKWLIDCIAERGEWPRFRHLTGIVEVPVMRSDGSVITRKGYDEATGLFYEPIGAVPEIPKQPSYEDVRYAREQLEETVADFPFKSPEHRAAWVAAIATCVCRFGFEGPAPMFVFDASTAGSGKTLLAQVASLIATGRTPAKYQFSHEDAEQRKVLTTIAIEADRAVLYDNIIGELGGAALCDALTATRWKDRILATNQSYDGPLLTTFFATGNNVRLGEDMHRRACHVRLEPRQERPEERTDFMHANLMQWAREHQSKLLGAILTIVHAYERAGRPSVDIEGRPMSLKPWGSYEGWTTAVRRPLVWAGFPDPALSREDLITSACLTDNAAARFVLGWRKLTHITNGGCTAGRALKLIYPDASPHAADSERDPLPELREPIEELVGDSRPNARQLGRVLAKHKGRVFGGLALQPRIKDGETLWSVIGQSDAGAQTVEGAGFRSAG